MNFIKDFYEFEDRIFCRVLGEILDNMIIFGFLFYGVMMERRGVK